MISTKGLILVLMAAVLAVSACGKKGDPIRPGTEQPEKNDPAN